MKTGPQPETKVLDWCRFGNVVMSFTAGGTIEDAVWNEFVEFLLAADGADLLFSVTSNDMGSMTATQRKSGADALKTMSLGALVITDSRVTRGILTAVGWLGADVRPRAWSALDKAVAEASSDPETQEQLRQAALAFRERTT